MPIRAVILDVGGVLTRVTNLHIFSEWERQLGLAPHSLLKTLFYGELSVQATLGKLGMDEFWAGLGTQLGLSPEQLERLKLDVWRGSEWDRELLDYVRSLRGQVKTAIISNAWPSSRDEMAPVINEGLFDVLVFSAEEGIAKPDPEIFRRALDRLGIAAEEAVFVDDQAPNVEAARALGMQGVHFRDSAQARAELDGLLRR